MSTNRFFGTTAVVLALAAPPVASAAPTSYTDPTGDNGAAVDVGSVTAELTADGYIHIKATVANVQLPSPVSASVVVGLDTDRSGSTGSLDGADYILGFDFKNVLLIFARWNGSEFVDANNPEQSDAKVVAAADGVEFLVRPAGLGGSAAFNFVVMGGTATAEGSFDFDFAPDNGSWSFEIAKSLTVETVNAMFVPALPRAGRLFQAPVVRVTLSDGRTVLAPSYRCVAQLAGKLLRGTGRGGCTFKLPQNAKGKRLAVKLFVTYKGVTDGFDPYVFKVR
jgi:hypothetical protein